MSTPTTDDNMLTLPQWLAQRASDTVPATDDLLGMLLPLAQQAAETHAEGKVAPFDAPDRIQVIANHPWYAISDAQAPEFNRSQVARIEQSARSKLEITDISRLDEDETGIRYESALIIDGNQAVQRPCLMADLNTWEFEVGHHDALSDIFALGMIFAAVAGGFDPSHKAGLKLWLENRHNIYNLNKNLHPAVGQTIAAMTQLERSKRTQDLQAVVEVLQNYRYQTPSEDGNWADNPAFATADGPQRQKLVLEHLRNRLFEISRRNRLLYFKQTMGMLNLSEASVPLLMNPEHIQLRHLFIWQDDVAKKLSKQKAITLGNYLRYDEVPYIGGMLDRIRNEDRRNRHEYGFSQLRLAIAFLRWHNLKETPEERIDSPLILLHVQVERKKGVRDQYRLVPLSSEAEVNPVLRHHLSNLYGVELPETIDLESTSLESFHQHLEQQLQKSEAAIQLKLSNKPKISLIRKRAKARLDQYQRRRKASGTGTRRFGNIPYSYNPKNYQPLGLQLFQHRVKQAASGLSELAEPTAKPRSPFMAQSNSDTTAEMPAKSDGGYLEKTFYQLEQSGSTNPYTWEFDLCNMVLGNFNYRKMSLVRDYNQLVNDGINQHPAFTELFSLAPRPQNNNEYAPLPSAENYRIVAADPTQAASVTRSRSGNSFIIQGPPGTGKSQTITNLIADYAAQGKRVLFVCEKRAAIDVVYHRLKQHGLDKLSCLIHDSQADKKAFIADLKNCYEYYLSQPDQKEAIEAARTEAVSSIERVEHYLSRRNNSMTELQERHGKSLRELLGFNIALNGDKPEQALDNITLESLPPYQLWETSGKNIRDLEASIIDLGAVKNFGSHPLRMLKAELLESEQPNREIQQRLLTLNDAYQQLLSLLGNTALPIHAGQSLGDLRDAFTYIEKIAALAEHNRLPLLRLGDPMMQELQSLTNERIALREQIEKSRQMTARWHDKLSRIDLPDVVMLAKRFEGKFFRFLIPAFWRLRKLIHSRYDLAAHATPPTYTRVLSDLASEYSLFDKLETADAEFNRNWGEQNAESLSNTLKQLQQHETELSAPQRALRDWLQQHHNDTGTTNQLIQLAPYWSNLHEALENALQAIDKLNLTELKHSLGRIEHSLGVLPELLPALRALQQSSPRLYQLAASYPWSANNLEFAITTAAINNIYHNDRPLAQLNHERHQQQLITLAENLAQLEEHNANTILQRFHHQFREKIALSGLPSAQLTTEQKPWKREYNRGRKELEHEFSKVMRHKSIRDLGANESGLVIRDLKPIWLMSPLSVSDTLPMDANAFDVVIFDEASQITVEEAVPALFRAKQTIVVGDEQQLPPTNFFSAKGSADEDDEEVVAALALDSDSFLNHSARSLPSTLLGWHYRSRYEALIDFSNAAFYQRELLTIPDSQLQTSSTAITVTNQANTANNTSSAISTVTEAAGGILDRPISFHHLSNGCYERRRNTAEAEYIAERVRDLLNDDSDVTVGIVAFSEAQQGEIEAALRRLAERDRHFSAAYEAEIEREEDDQYVGLFVKNLENVQGDERDVIIVSVCYGHDAKGQMRMNFGPINRQGGEKRLNVIFSRAKRHMAVVSSIQHHHITNDYNDGANCLKRYLRYAEASSAGDYAATRRILDEIHPEALDLGQELNSSALANAVANMLESKGYVIDRNVGSSHFRCDLAVRKPSSSQYMLGILLDTAAHYANPDLIEQYHLRPNILRAFGWKCETISSKDWHDNPEECSNRLLQALK